MKNISIAIKSLKNEDLAEFARTLNLKRANEKDITGAVLSISGLNNIMAGLTFKELEVFKAVYKKSDGMTFGEIEKILSLPIQEIEQLTKNLSGKLLVYRIKNRQLLSNKMDKVYGIKEISDILDVTDGNKVAEHLKKIVAVLESVHPESKKHVGSGISEILEYDRVKELLELIIESGFIINLEDIKDLIAKKSFDKIFSLLLDNSIIRIFYTFETKYTLLISLNEEAVPSLISHLEIAGKPGISIHNRYYFILNLLNAFDTISTYGLFLTKQNIFRKIDKKRIADSMNKLYGLDGEQIPPETCALLSLSLLSELKCLKLEKDIASISLKNIREGIDEPQKFLALILLIITNSRKSDPYFLFPIETAKYHTVSIIINILLKLKKTPPNYLKYLTSASLNIDHYDKSASIGSDSRPDKSDFEPAMEILSLLGLIEIREGLISLSDIGHDLVPLLQGIKPEHAAMVKIREDYQKCIYINPDFTLIIPVEEISSLALYHILSHTEIVKQDFVIHAIISRDAIIKAHKRGLPVKKFYDMLNKYSKNEIPQNLNFLLKEWANQTINIKISHAVLLKCNQAAFIEEVLTGKLKDSIIEQLSPNHAIINIDYIDDIIKLARKNDAVISLFEG